MLLFHRQIAEGIPLPKHPELPLHPCKGNQHQPRVKPVTWDDLWGRDNEPDTSTATASDLWPWRANIPTLPAHRLRLVSHSHCSHVSPAEYFVSHGISRSWSTAAVPQPCLEYGRAGHVSYLIFPRTSQAPGSQSLAAAKERSNSFRARICVWWDVSMLCMRARTAAVDCRFGAALLRIVRSFFAEQLALIPSSHL